MEPAEAVLKFLSSVGSSAEAEFYLRLFRSGAPERFAAIVVDADTVEDNAVGVAVDLRFLQALELTPVVVLGHHDPARGQSAANSLAARLVDASVAHRRLSSGAEVDQVVAAIRAGEVPLVVTSGGAQRDRLSSLGSLLTTLQTHKLIFLRDRGGLRPQGQRLSDIDLSTELDDIMAMSDLDPAQRDLVRQSRELIFELVPHKLLVTITSPLNLIHELFTVKGAGTLLRRGAELKRHLGYDGVDMERLRSLMTASFKRPLTERFWKRAVTHCYLEEDYRGAALVNDTQLGGYLTKFAVTRQAQGESIGADLWRALCADYSRLIWRARPDNQIRLWYERQCDGRVNRGGWIVYFRGLSTEDIHPAVELAVSKPVDL